MRYLVLTAILALAGCSGHGCRSSAGDASYPVIDRWWK